MLGLPRRDMHGAKVVAAVTHGGAISDKAHVPDQEDRGGCPTFFVPRFSEVGRGVGCTCGL